MRGHFRYLRFKTFLMTPRTPQYEVFCPLLLSSKHSGVPEDSKPNFFQVLGFTLTLGQSRVATLPERLSHKFMSPYAGPFKVLEKKLSDTYKLELPKNLRVHPTFHVSLLKPVSRDASRPNREQNSRPPPDLVHNEPEFEVEAVLKSRQLRGREREYLVKWKGYHAIEASWVNESDMEHAQKTIEEFHTRPAKKRRRA